MTSSFAAVQSSKFIFIHLTAAMIDTSNGRVCVFKFFQINCKRCGKNISSILKYNSEWKATNQTNDMLNC